MSAADTIYALASGAAAGAVAVLRLSGPRTSEAVRRLTGSLPPPNASGALPVAFDGCAIDFAVASTSEPQTLHLHPGQPRAPPGRNETI